ncbi:lysozyme [Methylobacterium sp. J-068]|uniref:lysozyme n=1 Tax=Methylobacterium sp. J-068 TaxID=2836649 RepID=UPI001FBA95D4|nr:lysozyme [Methylobacterium sp. J-068]MCJ2037079.1 lysozyme [Methylobacterium sp. J-068]
MTPLLAFLLPALSGLFLLCEPSAMEFSAIGRAALVSREGCKLTAYQDSVKVWTIACGVTSASGLIRVTPGLSITQAQADDLNRRAFEQYADDVRRLLKRPVTQEQFDTLVSLTFNIGPDAFAGSTVLRKLNAGDVSGVAEAILMWKKPASIISRRQAEYDQFRTPYAQALPKGRRSDKSPVRVLVSGVPVAAIPTLPASLPPKPTLAPPALAGAPAPAAAKTAPALGLSGFMARFAALFGRAPS